LRNPCVDWGKARATIIAVQQRNSISYPVRAEIVKQYKLSVG
jgi:hypothetical protein